MERWKRSSYTLHRLLCAPTISWPRLLAMANTPIIAGSLTAQAEVESPQCGCTADAFFSPTHMLSEALEKVSLAASLPWPPSASRQPPCSGCSSGYRDDAICASLMRARWMLNSTADGGCDRRSEEATQFMDGVPQVLQCITRAAHAEGESKGLQRLLGRGPTPLSRSGHTS